MSTPFVTLAEVLSLSGKTYTLAEQTRITELLPVVSDTLRYEAVKVGKNLDAMMLTDESYTNTVKLVTVDVIVRIMRQSSDGDPMSQESQSGLGYSWSGSYAIPGGGMAAAIMNNDLKRLGLRRQHIGILNLMHEYEVPDPQTAPAGFEGFIVRRHES